MKYFLGSVGFAEAFRIVDKKPVLAFVSRTLTDSGINISNTKDDIRGGMLAPVQFSFFHDANVDVSLTDVVFKTEYVEAQLGAKFEAIGEGYKSYNTKDNSSILTKVAGYIECSEEILKLPIGCGANVMFAWFAEMGTEDWKGVEVTYVAATTEPAHDAYWKIADASIETSKDYCVRFLGKDESARVAEITSDMIPEELFLVITAPLFAGDACAASRGQHAGTITFEIPRFRLSGAQDFAMAMSSNQTMSLNGSALAYTDGCGVNGSTLLRIREVVFDRKLYDGAVAIYSDGATSPNYYFVYKNGTVTPVAGSGYTVTVSNNEAAVKAEGGSTTLVTLPVISD